MESIRSVARLAAAAFLAAAAVYVALLGWRGFHHLFDEDKDSPDSFFWTFGLTFWAASGFLAAAAVVTGVRRAPRLRWLVLAIMAAVASLMPYQVIRKTTSGDETLRELRDDGYLAWPGVFEDSFGWTGLTWDPPGWMGYIVHGLLAVVLVIAVLQLARTGRKRVSAA